jgi:hypothetical protein
MQKTHDYKSTVNTSYYNISIEYMNTTHFFIAFWFLDMFDISSCLRQGAKMTQLLYISLCLFCCKVNVIVTMFEVSG